MTTITASLPCAAPPAWAVLQRELLRRASEAAPAYLARFTHPGGTLRWGGTKMQHGRDDVDDFYEAFYNFPLLYLLGGDATLLDLAHHAWNAVTRQLTDLGLVHDEFEVGADFFHQGEGLLAFYFLCLADPDNAQLVARAERFARLYMAPPNYDPVHHIVRAPHTGAKGPRWGYTDGDPADIVNDWPDFMEQFGLPFDDVPGVTTWADLRTPRGAAAMGAAMQTRFGRGDVAANLGVTSLVTNAFLLTGNEAYRAWVLEYVSAWQRRADEHGGLLPDNVSLDGVVGGDFGGRPYGGLYGWSWPHGFYNVGMSAVLGASNAFTLSGDARYLRLARGVIDAVNARGRAEDGVWKVPYRLTSDGWTEFRDMPPTLPTALWALTTAPEDEVRLARTLQGAWRRVEHRRGKEDAGHEGPWLAFLRGGLPDYPETILRQALGHVQRRMALARAFDVDLEDLGERNVHLWVHAWQQLNPVTTEALVQLTLGAPQFVYNGGLLFARVRYFDADARRPGLPDDVAALVRAIDETRTVVTLVNLSPLYERSLVVQAGTFAEHAWRGARFDTLEGGDYPGSLWNGAFPDVTARLATRDLHGPHLVVRLPPGTELTLHLETQLHAQPPTARLPNFDALLASERLASS